MSGNKNAFFNAKFSPSGKNILAYCYNGSACLYTRVVSSQHEYQYKQTFLQSGHFQEVTDISWSSQSQYLTTCSLDQTSRTYSEWTANNSWHEVSRSQIHGYDINSIANLPVKSNVADLIVCGADEKIIRVLEPPAVFVNMLNGLGTGRDDQQLHLFFPDG